jgi:GNAT superfamily N-acetyltransferase
MTLPAPLTLRHASSADAGLLAAIHATSWQAAYRGILPEAFLNGQVVNERAAFWHARMNAPDDGRRLVLIAELAGDAAGFVCVERPIGSPWGALLDNLHTLPQRQGIGVGKLLIGAAQDWARACGETQIHLYVLEGNTAAIAFYERQGWRPAGSEPDHMGGVDVTALRYAYRLN